MQTFAIFIPWQVDIFLKTQNPSTTAYAASNAGENGLFFKNLYFRPIFITFLPYISTISSKYLGIRSRST